jgi:CRISPR-associated protein Cas1
LVFDDCGDEFRQAPFRRRRDGVWPNNLLNYGYAILRAMAARALSGAGLLPEVGIQHHNRYDPFALASDLMEPFRPWVDHRCRELIPDGPGDLDRNTKQALLSVYEDPVLLDGEQTPLALAVESAASSLARVFLEAKAGATALAAAGCLRLPSFVELHEG